ncbi:hypothetical protein MtrunA17_Chr1g0186211 [Medicago truncatula]|uniref:Uncharacterized protein n=1 Tax=Medicago truncatula TaxID=3880 RepID=A0A072VM09_MEDTR|nr:hypothetical protein MTR_1g073460 [Medicago truncatula]RHN80249.1 hypothetical protein MtrunA17_Chr1g0186211 [Medicago truncatula]
MYMEGGFPHLIFSEHDQKEVYIAKLRKILDSTYDKVLDCVSASLKQGKRNGREIADDDLPPVRKMNVSTSFTFCSNSCRVMETEFTLKNHIPFNRTEKNRR